MSITSKQMPDTRRVFSISEVFDATMSELENDVFSTDVWMSKYALKNTEGELVELAPSMMHERVARELSRIESKYPNPLSYGEIHEKLSDWKIIPQGSPLSAIGNPYQMQSLSNCFVIPLCDSYASIMRADQELAQIMKRRGGVGLDVSALRPRGCPTANAAKTSAGIMPFLDRFSRTCREVGQNGRRGALMLTISVAHPQVEDFIDAKNDRDKTAITGANMSVKITDEFMHAVSDDVDFTLRWPVASSPADARVTRVVKARDVWNKIVRAAHASGEPGILMWDNIIRNSPADMYASVGFETISTNPCVAGDTVVETTAGPRTVSELSDLDAVFNVQTYDETTQSVKIAPATAFKTRDRAKLFCLKLKNGRRVKLTAEHLVRTDSGWKRADQLTNTDKVLSFESVRLLAKDMQDD